MVPIFTSPVPLTEAMSLVKRADRNGTAAMTVSRMIWMEDWKKAKTRPRVASSTSRPTMVKPVE